MTDQSDLLLKMANGYLADGRAMLKEAMRLNFMAHAASYPGPGGAEPAPKVVALRSFRESRVEHLLREAAAQHAMALACISGAKAIIEAAQ